MEVKPGYKQTEVGVIPEEWSLQPLGSIGKWFSGGTPSMSVEAYWSGDIPWVSPKDMKVPRLHDSIDHITTKAVASGVRLLPVGAILIVIRGMILVHSVPVARAEIALAFNQDIKAVVTTHDIDDEFMLYWLTANAQRLRGLTTESTHGTKRLPTEMLFRELVACPSAPEQEAIAEALSDADALIESLEQLIAKKRYIKQGAMQELLTGKQRLPRFSGEWEVKLFGEIAQLRKERIDPRQAGRHEFCIELEHIEQGTGCLAGHTATSEGSSLKSVFQKDDVLFGKLRAYLRKYWLANREGVCSTEIWVLTAKRALLTPQFLFQLVNVDRFIEAASSAYGTHMPRSDWNVVKNYEVRLPPVPEQTAIAAILSDMDAEIAALEAKLGKARQIKQGMMHNLLTGRIRLVGGA